MENTVYKQFLQEKDQKFESICKRCGECCGSLDDPCTNLQENGDGTYLCNGYDDRLGPQKTVSGNEFTCVSIREHIAHKSLRQNCSYR